MVQFFSLCSFLLDTFFYIHSNSKSNKIKKKVTKKNEIQLLFLLVHILFLHYLKSIIRAELHYYILFLQYITSVI
jgi:hypothetical protein